MSSGKLITNLSETNLRLIVKTLQELPAARNPHGETMTSLLALALSCRETGTRVELIIHRPED